MPGLQAGDLVEVRWDGICFGQQIVMVHTYRVADSADPSTTVSSNLNDILTRIAVGGVQDITTNYLACLPPQYSLLKTTAQRIWPARSAYRSNTTLFPGTNAGAATVANDSAALTFRTEFAGKNQRATKHIGPIPDSVSAQGLLDNGYKTDLVGLALELLQTIFPIATTGRLVPVIIHRADMTTDDMTGYVIGDQSRVQRRRTVGVGR